MRAERIKIKFNGENDISGLSGVVLMIFLYFL